MILDVSFKNMALLVFIWLAKKSLYNVVILLMKLPTKFLNIMGKIKRTFSNAVRMPYQDSIAMVTRIIEFHNEQALKDFGNQEFHQRQAMTLKLWLIDLKEFIIKHEKKESLSVQDTEEETGREEVLSSIKKDAG
jgi:hypothetical protein